MPTPSLLLALALVAVPASPRARAIERMNEGVALARRSQSAAAEQALREALRIDPQLGHAWLNLGHLQLRAQRIDAAAISFGKGLAVAEGPIATELHLQLGLLLYGSAPGQRGPRERRAVVEAALEHLHEAAPGEPDLAFLHVTIGDAHQQLDQPEPADAAYRRAIELDPTFTPAFVALGNLYIDHGYANLGVGVLELGVQSSEGDARAWSGLGRGLAALDRNREAIEAFERALQLDPSDHELLFQLGMTHADLRERKKAVARLREYIERAGPEIPLVRLRAAKVTMARMEDVI